jgi:isochorismate pyruvate lyase
MGPKSCADMASLRALIDRIDRDLVALLAERAACIDRAAELKRGAKLPARIEARVGEVLDNVRAEAAAQGLDPDLAAALWRRLIEWSIAREERALGDGIST